MHQVAPSTGLVTAVGAGKTTIYAVREQDELYTKYGQECQLKYELTVIDAFGLSLDKANVNIGESFDLEALVTNDVTKYPVEFKVENRQGLQELFLQVILLQLNRMVRCLP